MIECNGSGLRIHDAALFHHVAQFVPTCRLDHEFILTSRFIQETKVCIAMAGEDRRAA